LGRAQCAHPSAPNRVTQANVTQANVTQANATQAEEQGHHLGAGVRGRPRDCPPRDWPPRNLRWQVRSHLPSGSALSRTKLARHRLRSPPPGNGT